MIPSGIILRLPLPFPIADFALFRTAGGGLKNQPPLRANKPFPDFWDH
ncbi:MAG: hypothetical protein GXY72_00635 [Deltaproteobacteria bacterium]|nr:hypothetical protein [Syntrophaceae bacterium]NLX50589.1 hypothetical protein [Deltaproteobacteria bacterium]